MNKKIFLLVLIIGLLFLNLTDLKSFFIIIFEILIFKEESYDGVIKEFEKSKNINGFYNKANSLYKKGEYEEAIKEYISILNDEKNKINFKINHNLGNSYYRLGEQDEQNKLNYRQKSVDYYKKALDIIYDEETKQNLEFILNKINELKNKDENNEDKDKDNQDSKDSGNDDNSNQNSNGNNDNGEKGNEKDGNQDNDSQDSNSEDGKDSNGASQGEEKNSLDKDKAEAIKQYEQSLKDIQKQNGEYFNKVYEGGTNDIFDNMFNDPFFDNSLLNDNNGEKDW